MGLLEKCYPHEANTYASKSNALITCLVTINQSLQTCHRCGLDISHLKISMHETCEAQGFLI